MTSSRPKAKTFRVHIEDRNGLFVATSPELKGMLVVGRSVEAVTNAIPKEVEDLFAACGSKVIVSEVEDDDQELTPWVAVPAEFARRALETA
jgi:hypothetical protein